MSDFEYLRQVLSNNAFAQRTLEQQENNQLGFGISVYEVVNFFNHSCLPNASWSHDHGKTGYSIRLTADRTVQAGEEIFISYFDLSRDLQRRQESMLQYGFICKCARCVVESASHLSLQTDAMTHPTFKHFFCDRQCYI